MSDLPSRAVAIGDWFQQYRSTVPIGAQNYVNLKTALTYLVDGDPFDLEILDGVLVLFDGLPEISDEK